MLEFFKAHQLELMLVLSGICAVIALFAAMTRTLPKKRKGALIYIEVSACLLLMSDRFAYIYRGDVSTLGYWMVRISNALVFILTLALIHAMSRYVCDLCLNEVGLDKVPVRLRILEILVVVGWILIGISQFTGIYYTFDEYNRYERGPLFLVCYIIPLLGLLVLLSVIIEHYGKFDRYVRVPLVLFSVVPMVASIVQVFTYGLSLTNISIVGMVIVLYAFAIEEMNEKIEKANRNAMEVLKAEREVSEKIFEQTAAAIAASLDERTEFTRGHALRVAGYSREIAKLSGMSERECFDVYCAALLHDLGKIKVSNSILLKASGLTAAEQDTLRKHAEIGGEVLSGVTDFPALSATAAAHHERFDGKGYPKGLRGDSIPVMARIVAVADAYDCMASNRTHKGPLAQGLIRETLIEGSGKQFDPKYVSIMVDMIDRDTEYVMRENDETAVDRAEMLDLGKVDSLHFSEYKETVSDGIKLTSNITRIRLDWRPDAGYDPRTSLPAIVLFDSLDGCVHMDERSIKNLHYTEYGEIWFDGHSVCTDARDIKTEITDNPEFDKDSQNGVVSAVIEAVKFKDHLQIKILGGEKSISVITALPDTSRFAYLSITGEYCHIENVSVSTDPEPVAADYIPRIVEEISYFDRQEGDLPNVQVDGYRTSASEGIEVSDGMRVYFHTKTMPTATAVLHCAYVVLFTSDNGQVGGRNYHEYACIRLDGEDATVGDKSVNELTVKREESFEGWDAWKKYNKKGLDYEVIFKRRRGRVTFTTDNAGIGIKCVTTIPKGFDNVYAALTGEQCTLTDIRVL